MNRDTLVTEMRRLAVLAGVEIMTVYESDDAGVQAKADESPVTRADMLADAVISDGLRAAFPDIALVTEEQAATHGTAPDVFLIVDPLDGTKEFIKKGGDFTVNIALVEHGVPTLGVVYAPAKARMFFTPAVGGVVEETGSFDPGLPGPVRPISVRAADNDALSAVASLSHRTPETDTYLARYAVADLKSAGSSLKFCLVATGEADLYPRLGPTMEWDTAAGDAVLRAAGGRVVDFDTREPLVYGKPGYRNPQFIAHAASVNLR